MEENKKTQAQSATELTPEQIKGIAQQLAKENAALKKQIEEMGYFNLFKRLDYLFKVLEFGCNFDMSFVDKCRDEIVTLMTPAEEETTAATENPVPETIEA